MFSFKYLCSVAVLSSMLVTLSSFGAAVSSTALASHATPTDLGALNCSKLMRAIASFYPVERLKVLVDKGADVNGQDGRGTTPLRLACIKGRLDVVRYLFEQKAQITRNQDFTILSCTSDASVARFLLDQGEDPNGLSDRTYDTPGVARGGTTELIIAARQMHDYEKIRLLLERGARVNDCVQDITRTPQNALYNLINRALWHLEQLHGTYGIIFPEQKGNLTTKVDAIVPAICLLLCNGADVTVETLDTLDNLIKENNDTVDDDPQYHEQIREGRSAIAHKLREIAQVLLDVCLRMDDKKEQEKPQSALTIKCLEMKKELFGAYEAPKKSFIAHVLAQHNLTSVGTCCIIDPCKQKKSVSVNVFNQLIARQAGNPRVPVVLPCAASFLQSSAAVAVSMKWPTRAELVQEQETKMREVTSLMKEEESGARKKLFLEMVQKVQERQNLASALANYSTSTLHAYCAPFSMYSAQTRYAVYQKLTHTTGQPVLAIMPVAKKRSER